MNNHIPFQREESESSFSSYSRGVNIGDYQMFRSSQQLANYDAAIFQNGQQGRRNGDSAWSRMVLDGTGVECNVDNMIGRCERLPAWGSSESLWELFTLLENRWG